MNEIQRKIEAGKLEEKRRYYAERVENAPVLEDYDDGLSEALESA